MGLSYHAGSLCSNDGYPFKRDPWLDSPVALDYTPPAVKG